MELNDSIFNLGELLTENEVGYYVDNRLNREMTYIEKDFMNSITYEMSLDKHVHFRRVYSLFDWAADIGGILGAVTAICGFILYLFHSNSQYLYLMKEMFVEPVSYSDELSKSKRHMEDEARDKIKNTTQWDCFSVVAVNLKMCLPKRLQVLCLKKRHRDLLQI